jgi:hypothetical protein
MRRRRPQAAPARGGRIAWRSAIGAAIVWIMFVAFLFYALPILAAR